jgi:hypothetical protein
MPEYSSPEKFMVGNLMSSLRLLDGADMSPNPVQASPRVMSIKVLLGEKVALKEVEGDVAWHHRR